MDTVIVALSVLNLVVVGAVGGYAVVLLRRATQADDGAALDERLAKLAEAEERRATLLGGRFEDALRKSGEGVQGSLRQAFDELRTSVNKDLAAGRGETTVTLDRVTKTLEERIKALQEDNSRKLDQMRATVDERLQKTLEARLGESFKMVSERLEMVHKGLGEMQTLASGVGDLKKVLTNVKTRGTWGEIQLGNLLEQLLTPEQFAAQVATKRGSRERVDFAIRLPGRDETAGQTVWLPIDAKFPQEDHLRLIEAQERADPVAAEAAGKQLEERLKSCARDIRDKYLNPPETTDFAIMYLPNEGLFAEALRRPGLCETVQRNYRVSVAGPTTLAALLNSLQMGFRTLAIQQRSSEVWKVLGAVKMEFDKFGGILEKVHKQLQTASDTIDDATKKTRTIRTKLGKVQELPVDDAQRLLAIDGDAAEQTAPAGGDAVEENGQ